MAVVVSAMGTLYIVSTPIGNLEDITFRALRILKEVNFIAAEDTRHTRKLLTHFDIHTPLVSYHQHNEVSKIESLLDKIDAGINIALVSDAGTPAISDPGFKLVRAAVERGIKVEAIPGASAIITALAVAGLPTDQFTFCGFLPDKPGKRQNRLEELKPLPQTLVFYVSKWKAKAVLEDILQVLGDRNAAFCRELTKMFEEISRGKVSEILAGIGDKEVKGEITLVVEGAECSKN